MASSPMIRAQFWIIWGAGVNSPAERHEAVGVLTEGLSLINLGKYNDILNDGSAGSGMFGDGLLPGKILSGKHPSPW